MTVYAAVTTGKGSAAIATIQVFGRESASTIEQIFKPASANPPALEAGNVLLGTIVDGSSTIDQVTVGCQGPEGVAIHCHGNPLIVEQIAQLLQRHEAKLVPGEELLRRIAESAGNLNAIEIEAKVAQLKARTVAGTKLILNQIDFGLRRKAQDWLDNFDEISLDEIKGDVLTVVRQSERARLIIEGCTVILAGPPNSGKSTLLNTLAGREKAIVSHIEGTTRDWVEARCHIGPLEVTLTDTAGLDEVLASESDSEADRDSQKRSSEILERADLVLLILENSRGVGQVSPRIISAIEGENVLVVLNKDDLPTVLEASALPDKLGVPVQVSAKDNKGIHELHRRILEATGTAKFDLHTPIAFTDRQRQIFSQLATAESKAEAKALISKLLNESLSV